MLEDQAGSLASKLDAFEAILDKLSVGDDIRVSKTDISVLREIQKKLEIVHSLSNRVVPEKSLHAHDKVKANRRSMIKSMVSGVDMYGASLADVPVEFYSRTEDILEVIKDSGEFVLSKLAEIQKIRIACLNSELSGMVVNYLIRHMVNTMAGLDKCVVILVDKVTDEFVRFESPRAFGSKIEQAFLTQDLLRMLDAELKPVVGLSKLSNRCGKTLEKLFDVEKEKLKPTENSKTSNQSSPTKLSKVVSTDNQLSFYGSWHEEPSFVCYTIGYNETGNDHYARILARRSADSEMIRSYLDNFIRLIARHLLEFMMERTSQYYYTWMLFNADMILATHALAIIAVIIEDALGGDDDIVFVDKAGELYKSLSKDNDDFLFHHHDKTMLIFRKFGFLIGMKRQNYNFYPLYNKVSNSSLHILTSDKELF
jgi:hypothetical protein